MHGKNIAIPEKREDYLKYCKIRNKVPRCIRYSKRKFEKGIAIDSKVNPRSF